MKSKMPSKLSTEIHFFTGQPNRAGTGVEKEHIVTYQVLKRTRSIFTQALQQTYNLTF